MEKILIVEDDAQLAATFQRLLKGAGYLTDVATDYDYGKQLLMADSYSAVFIDINLQGKQTGIDLLKEVREINLDTPVIIMTGAPELETAVDAVRNAAFDYLCKPIEKEQLLEVARTAVRHKMMNDEKIIEQQNLAAAFKSVKEAIAAVEPYSSLTGQNSTSPAHALSPKNPEALLSERERLVLSMLGDGESSADIASTLSISVRTVESYCARIISKLDLNGMKTLRRYAIQIKKQ